MRLCGDRQRKIAVPLRDLKATILRSFPVAWALSSVPSLGSSAEAGERDLEYGFGRCIWASCLTNEPKFTSSVGNIRGSSDRNKYDVSLKGPMWRDNAQVRC